MQALAFRVYAISELLGMRNEGMARDILGHAGQADLEILETCGLPVRPEDFKFLGGCGAVVELVNGMSAQDAGLVARVLSELRGNGAHRRITDFKSWAISESVPFEKISIGPAEIWVADLFEKHCWNVRQIASDPGLWKQKPYSEWPPGCEVEYETILATRQPRGKFRCFDGIHRLIQLVRNGERAVDVCCPSF